MTELEYDGEDEDSDTRYFEFVQHLSALTATELRLVKYDAEGQRQALCRYYRRGQAADISPSELIDFLAVSTPSILDIAGYSEEEGDATMQISDQLTEEEILSIALPEDA